MSWAITVAGTKDNVKAVIDADKHLPLPVKELIKGQVDQLRMEPQYGDGGMVYEVFVQTWGHIDQDMLDIGCVKVQRVACGLKPKPAAEPNT